MAPLPMLQFWALHHKCTALMRYGPMARPELPACRPMARTRTLPAVSVSLYALASTAIAECVDINADPVDRLTAIAHINDERALQLIAGRSWPSVRSLTGINGLGRGRIRDILEQDLACVGVRAPRS